jgi:acid stress-induced BolA-like protein IbaG/YrbA
MDLRQKVERALQAAFDPDEMRLEEDEGLSGYVISQRFRGMEAIDRQRIIYDALHEPSVGLGPDEMRDILAIAALTPEEFALVEVG